MTVAFWIGLSLVIGLVIWGYSKSDSKSDSEPISRAVLESDRLTGVAGAIALGLVFLLGSSQPAIASPHLSPSLAALGTSEDTLDRRQQALEEKLKVDPTGDHYKGIEYSTASVRNQPNDQALLDEIQPQLSDDVVIAISNGSVRLSGKVKDRATAEGIVEQIKSTAGVHEVAFDLGLESIDQKTIR